MYRSGPIYSVIGTARHLLNFSSVYFSFKEKEKLYVELKHIMVRQPGPEAAEQLQQCRWIIRERTKKLKVLTQLPFSH